MPDLIPIEVECHSGYKADEYPRCFYLNNDKYEIIEISDRWYQCDNSAGWPVADYFKVIANTGRQCILKHEIKCDKWYLVIGK
jgi:hypothetical protein